MEDLFLWHTFELFDLLIGNEVRASHIQCQPALRNTFYQAWSLYPEWLNARYMSIDREERKQRIELIFGDTALAIEPNLNVIPRDIYERLEYALIHTHKPLITGENDVDLLLLQTPWRLPLEHLLQLICDYIRRLYAHRSVSSPIKVGGKGGLIARRQHELVMVGRYRLFAANQFNLERTKEAAFLDARSDGRIFTRAKRSVDYLFPRRWQLLNNALSLYAGGPR